MDEQFVDLELICLGCGEKINLKTKGNKNSSSHKHKRICYTCQRVETHEIRKVE